MNTKHDGSYQSQLTIDEAMQLIRSMQFRASRGDVTKGDNVRVDIIPNWNENKETFNVHIDCFALGAYPVEWTDLPIFISFKDTDTKIHAIAHLNKQGQGFINQLQPEKRFILTGSTCWGTSNGFVSIPSANPISTGSTNDMIEEESSFPVKPLEAKGAPSFFDPSSFPPIYKSVDNQLSATISQDINGKNIVLFDTDNGELASANIVFALKKPDGFIEYSDTLILKPLSSGKRWAVTQILPDKVSEPCELVFAAILNECE